MYINCKTYFSYRYGTYSTKQLVEQAVEQGARTMALTNINGTPDAWEFVKLCREAKIKPIIGCEIRNEHRFCYILLAKNEAGLCALNSFLSRHKKEGRAFPDRPEGLNEVYLSGQKRNCNRMESGLKWFPGSMLADPDWLKDWSKLWLPFLRTQSTKGSSISFFSCISR